MTMMVTRAPCDEVVKALSRAVDELNWTTVFVDTRQHKTELHRGVNLFTWGDDIRVHMVEIDPVMIVHVQSRIADRDPQVMHWKGHHIKNERRLLEAMMDDLGDDVCHILD